MSPIERTSGNLVKALSKSWWLIFLRGIIAIAFGVLLITKPDTSLAGLILFFGIYTLIDGLFSSWSAISHRNERDNWKMLLLSGLCGIAIGLITLLTPAVTLIVLLSFVAIWCIVTGLIQIITAIRLRAEIQGEWWMILSGLVSVVFGIYLLTNTSVGIQSTLWVIGFFAILFGVLLVALSFKVKSLLGKVANNFYDKR
ncbi:MAG: HdeD family acid-resistance protein [Arenimonas sp.]|nr:HdeD family acid-resistance protein [Arenimonas sp.]